MTVCWADPLDLYGGDESAMTDGAWAEIGSGWSLSTANPRTGLYSLRMANGSAGPARRTLGAAKQVAKLATAMFLEVLPTSEFVLGVGGIRPALMIHQYRDAANGVQVSIGVGTDGRLIAWQSGYYLVGAGTPIGVKLGESGQCIHANSYDHVESRVGIHLTDGFVEVRVNGVTVINLTGVNTNPTGLGETSQTVTQNIGTGGIGGYLDICDLIASDDLGAHNTDFVGDQKVFWLPPDSDTAQADWTPSTGATSYGVLDEAPPNDTDYLSLAATTGKTDVGCANLPGGVVSVAAVIATIRSRKDDAGVCDLNPGIKSGATYATGAGQPQTTAALYFNQVFEVDPVSTAPFTPAEVNALKLVLERTA